MDGALVFWWGARAGVCDLRSGVLRSFGIAGAIRREVGEDQGGDLLDEVLNFEILWAVEDCGVGYGFDRLDDHERREVEVFWTDLRLALFEEGSKHLLNPSCQSILRSGPPAPGDLLYQHPVQFRVDSVQPQRSPY